MRKLLAVLLLVGLMAISAGCSEPGKDAETGEAEVVEPVTTEDKNGGSMSKSYVKSELTPLVNSIASTVDSTWKFYFTEPAERFAKNGNRESYVSDVELCRSLLKGVFPKIESLEAPDYLSSEDKRSVNVIRESLHKAVTSRLEALEIALETDKLSESELLDKIKNSNTHLENASLAYKDLRAKYQ